MTRGVARLNELRPSEAEEALKRCCGSSEWSRRVAALRPFSSDAALFEAADRVWSSLTEADWLEAFASHPRIGERHMDRAGGASAWAQQEQAGAAAAAEDVKDRLARLNQEYESRFGFVYLVCATGKSAEQMLALLEERMNHDRATEVRIAAEQQSEITRLRLQRMLYE